MKKHLTPSLEALEDEQNSLFDFLEEAYMLSKLDSSYVNSLIGIGIKSDRKWTVNFNHLLHDRSLSLFFDLLIQGYFNHIFSLDSN